MDKANPSLFVKIADYLGGIIPIENSRRSLINSGVVLTHYIMDYLILWALLSIRLRNF